MSAASTYYRRPGSITRKLMNPLVMAAVRAGISPLGSRILEVRGRKSGIARRTPVNVLELGGLQYLVSPRGETEWVQNVRSCGGKVAILVGRRRDERTARELADADKPAVLRAYLRRWKAEVGSFFDGVGPDSSPGELQRIAPRHPVFVLEESAAS